MAPIKTRDIKAALLNKSFQKTEGSRHELYFLYVNGKISKVMTFLSRGIREYDDNLLGEIKKQLHLTSRRELNDLISCPMSGEDLIELLKERGELKCE